MKWIAAIALSFAGLGCESSTQPTTATLSAMRFSVTPLGERIKATRIDEQNGDRVSNPIVLSDFQEVTIAQGSGLEGFDAIRVYQDRSGYIVFSEQRDRNKRVAISITAEEMTGLLQTLNRDKIAEIEGLYSSGVHDGTQGFIEIRASGGRRFCWLDNHFDPVEHTFDFCNRVIWPKIEGAQIEKKGIGRQEEYYRVFRPGKQNRVGGGSNPRPPHHRPYGFDCAALAAARCPAGICLASFGCSTAVPAVTRHSGE